MICDTKNLTQQQIVVTCKWVNLHKIIFYVACKFICYSDRLNSSGIFIIMSYIIDKYEKEFEIDVCTAIRTVRRSGISYIQNLVSVKNTLTILIFNFLGATKIFICMYHRIFKKI